VIALKKEARPRKEKTDQRGKKGSKSTGGEEVHYRKKKEEQFPMGWGQFLTGIQQISVEEHELSLMKGGGVGRSARII